MTLPKLTERAMTSRTYGGYVIRTPWNAHDRWTLAAQMAQAAIHRDRVLAYLDANRQRRLATWLEAA